MWSVATTKKVIILDFKLFYKHFVFVDKGNFDNKNPIEVNGNSYDEILNVLDNIDYSQTNVIISNTTKGKGIEFMEGKTEFHSYNILSSEKEVLYKRAMECLGGDKMA